MPFDPRKYLVLMMYTIFAILICTYVFGNENGDLSKKTYPVENVKVIEILDKIEKIEKDGDKECKKNIPTYLFFLMKYMSTLIMEPST